MPPTIAMKVLERLAVVETKVEDLMKWRNHIIGMWVTVLGGIILLVARSYVLAR